MPSFVDPARWVCRVCGQPIAEYIQKLDVDAYMVGGEVRFLPGGRKIHRVEPCGHEEPPVSASFGPLLRLHFKSKGMRRPDGKFWEGDEGIRQLASLVREAEMNDV